MRCPISTPPQAEGQPGLQAGMAAQPVTTGLPTQHGGQDVLTLEEYTGVGKLRGKVAVITGGDSGIGRAAAVMMAKEKLKACAIAHMPKEQEAEGCEPILVACDLAEGESVVSKYGKVDILVNNAAEQHVVPSVTEVDAAQLEHTFKVNVFPMFYLAKHVVPHMPRGASIISTKGAIVAFTRSLAQQLAPKGIRVNAVAPGPPGVYLLHWPGAAPQRGLCGERLMERRGWKGVDGINAVDLVVLTWGSRMPAKPDKLKLRKRIEWAPLPIRVNLKARGAAESWGRGQRASRERAAEGGGGAWGGARRGSGGRGERRQDAGAAADALLSRTAPAGGLHRRLRWRAGCTDACNACLAPQADYDTETREFSYGMTCKDTLLGGRFSLNLAQNSIEYRKRFPCPNGMTVSLNGTVRLEDRTVKPTVWAQLEFGSSGSAGDSRATLVHGPTGDSWDVRQRLRVLKGLKFEVCGSTKVPTPAARFSSDHGRLSVGEGAFHLHVAEINAVVSL
eukprot:scaffold14.g1041.t1